jgi:hypothetical protein
VTAIMDDLEKAKILKALRFLNMLVVSLDRIGSYAAGQKMDHAKLLQDFIRDFQVFKEAAEARTALGEFFDDEIPDGQDASELEILMRDVKHWTAPPGR